MRDNDGRLAVGDIYSYGFGLAEGSAPSVEQRAGHLDGVCCASFEGTGGDQTAIAAMDLELLDGWADRELGQFLFAIDRLRES